jgi:hypothetical protein
MSTTTDKREEIVQDNDWLHLIADRIHRMFDPDDHGTCRATLLGNLIVAAAVDRVGFVQDDYNSYVKLLGISAEAVCEIMVHADLAARMDKNDMGDSTLLCRLVDCVVENITNKLDGAKRISTDEEMRETFSNQQ